MNNLRSMVQESKNFISHLGSWFNVALVNSIQIQKQVQQIHLKTGQSSNWENGKQTIAGFSKQFYSSF